jgi:hypothetical protein
MLRYLLGLGGMPMSARVNSEGEKFEPSLLENVLKLTSGDAVFFSETAHRYTFRVSFVLRRGILSVPVRFFRFRKTLRRLGACLLLPSLGESSNVWFNASAKQY